MRAVGEIGDVVDARHRRHEARPPTLMKMRSAARTSPPTRTVSADSKRAWPAMNRAVRPSSRSAAFTPSRDWRDDGVLARLDRAACRHRCRRPTPTPIFGRAARHMCGIGARDHRLGRRAAGVDAGAADELPFDKDDRLSRRGKAECERGACLPRTNDDRVIVRHGRAPCVPGTMQPRAGAHVT